MKTALKNLSLTLMMAGAVMGSHALAATTTDKVVIAHRGAS